VEQRWCQLEKSDTAPSSSGDVASRTSGQGSTPTGVSLERNREREREDLRKRR
ncbi:hypothetical protein TorRG33x02_120750, partial [Trema orientale]